MDLGADEMGTCRDTLMALLDYLVEPLLPSRSKLREDISLSDQELVAKQVHAVVLLYNYYHRKQNPGLAFLEFQSFCKLAVDLKPSLQLYFKVAQKTDYSELEGDKDLSVTEKAIMSACHTCKSLDVLNNNPIVDGWPITKVAIFLVDSKKENCVLFHSSITQGVWSVIEKDVIDTNQGLETSTKVSANKKKQILKRMDAASLHQLAYLAVKETCGINQADLKILDNHSVYSTNRPKTTVRLYIMQCTQTNEDMNLVPINDVMDCLQGSLVDMECVTPVVEYFHLIPFVDKVLDCLNSGREMSQDSPQHFEVAVEVGSCNGSTSSMEQPPDHFEAVGNIHNGSHLREEPFPSVSEQICTIFAASKEPNLNISEFIEATEEVMEGNTRHLKEDPVAVAPKYCAASEARNCNNHHLKEESDAVAPKHCEASEARNGNSQNLKGGPFPNASQPFAEQVDFPNVQHFESEKGIQGLSMYQPKEHRTEPVVYKKRNRSQKNSTTCKIPCAMTSNVLADCPRQKEEQFGANGSSNNMDINGEKSHFPCDDVAHNLNLMLFAEEADQAAVAGGAIVAAELPDACSKDCDMEKALSNHRIIDTAMSYDIGRQGSAFVPFGSEFEHLHKMQLTIISMDPLVSKTALQVLLRKREQLSQKLRNIADEIALCEGNIQTILRGGEDHLAVKLETLVDGCNERFLQTVGGVGEDATQHYNYQDLPPVVKRRKLSEANLSVPSPCQELDGICSKNFWMLPTYILSTLEGGFQAIANVKGADFDCSSEGAACTTPLEARNSAASKVLAKLRSLAGMS